MVGAIHCYRIHNLATIGHSQLVRPLERILEEANISGELILTNRRLKDFPIALTKSSLSDTVIADLSRNRFSELPEEVTTFVFLETLLLYHNTIRLIPESVKQLTLLTYLDLRSNQLTTLPKELCSMPLQVLLVSNNRLLSLPDELGRMEKLTDLDASYNQLTALPTRVGELRNLKSFSLRNNQILYLPKELGALTLVSLDVSNNRIASLPLEIRQMTALVELKLENNPLISPPASLCVRGLVHIFKFLENQATKDEKGYQTGSIYDGYCTLRRTPKQNAGIVFELAKNSRYEIDSEYNTCNSIDKLCSPHMANKNSKSGLWLQRKVLPRSTLDNSRPDKSARGSSKQLHKKQLCFAQENRMNDDLIKCSQTISSSDSTAEEDILSENIVNENKHLVNIQTYREYKEALKQQRNQEISNAYKVKPKELCDTSEEHDPISFNEEDSKSKGNKINSVNGLGEIKELISAPMGPVQKVLASRNTELMSVFQTKLKQKTSTQNINNECLGYLKPNSFIKTLDNGNKPMSNNSTPANVVIRSKIVPEEVSKRQQYLASQNNANRSASCDLPIEKLSFTMRREFDRQREEIELLKHLRNIIQVRLKMVLAEDMASALADGVILCHLANNLKPRSVASIHVPSPGVSKLTMARCRKNVDNFLEACRKIGVDENLICCAADILEGKGVVHVALTVSELFRLYQTSYDNNLGSPTLDRQLDSSSLAV